MVQSAGYARLLMGKEEQSGSLQTAGLVFP